MPHCPFCKILDNPDDSHIIYQDEHCYVIPDIYPMTKGHCLVVTKKHVTSIQQLDAKDRESLFEVANTLTPVIEEVVAAVASHLLINNGPSAWQHFPHVHLHIIPRHPKFKFQLLSGFIRKPFYFFLKPKTLKQMASDIQNKLAYRTNH